MGRQPDALRLTAAERHGGALQRQIIEPDIAQKAEPRLDLLDNLPRDQLFAFGKNGFIPAIQRGHPGQRLRYRESANIKDIFFADGHGQCFRLQAFTLALQTRLSDHIALCFGAGIFRFGFPVKALHTRYDAFPAFDVLPHLTETSAIFVPFEIFSVKQQI